MNIEYEDTGLKCDNPNCDWTDTTISLNELSNYINKPCPKCGENVLTEEDYNNAMALEGMINVINSMTPEELAEFNENMLKLIETGAIQPPPFFEKIMGLGENQKVTVDTHQGINIIINEDESETKS